MQSGRDLRDLQVLRSDRRKKDFIYKEKLQNIESSICDLKLLIKYESQMVVRTRRLYRIFFIFSVNIQNSS